MSKYLIFLSIIIIFFYSCTKKDIKELGFNYKILDTVYISRNGFNQIVNTIIIIQCDSNYYVATMINDKVISIDRKLKCKKYE